MTLEALPRFLLLRHFVSDLVCSSGISVICADPASRDGVSDTGVVAAAGDAYAVLVEHVCP